MNSSTPAGLAASSDLPAAAGATSGAPRVVATWLLVCCTLVFALIVVGGVTRLTHSGLSITEWQPILGTLPPLSESQWNEAFAKYQMTPEYLQVNRGMSIDAFKGIFWMEYVHRLLGRLVGFAFIVPQLWLTAHLGLALLIFAAMFWTALTLLRPGGAADARMRPLLRGAVSLAALIFVMALSGGLVAGIRAGFAYNTFPLMNGHVVPPEIMQISPWYMNFVNNMATVQFDHRLLAWTLLVLVPIWWWRVRATPEVPARARLAAHLLLAILLAPVSLG